MATKTKKTEDSKPASIAASIQPTPIEEYMIDSYHKYKCYIIAGRVCCNYRDGFLNIYRRILYSAFNKCRTHFIKSATLEGDVMGNYSPHGGAYSSICKLVNFGFLEKQGSFENNMGLLKIEASAKRYTEVMLSPISEILFLNNDLLPYVDYAETELSTVNNKNYEPLFLPVLVPGVYTSIGEMSEFESYMALKTKPVYPRYNVLSLLEYIIRYLTTGEFVNSLLYYQYHNLLLRSNEDDTLSKFSVSFSFPTYKDDDNNVHITATLPFVQMSTLLKDVPYEDCTGSLTDILIPEKYFDLEDFTKTVNFNVKAFKLLDQDYQNVIMTDYPIQYAVKVILHNLKDIIFPRYFEDNIRKRENILSDYNMLLNIRNKYMKESISFDSMSKEEQTIASKYRVNTFLTIEDKIDHIQKEINEFKTRSKNIDKEILMLYKDAYKKVKKYIEEYSRSNDLVWQDITKN